ncbi:MAG: hypothetical protein JO129_02965 [Candidatus Dependentiae bacterium]|nr:hypothetical protein [Candidatus Dependentiae bacterium]
MKNIILLFFTLVVSISLNMHGMNKKNPDTARVPTPTPVYEIECFACNKNIQFTDEDYEKYQASESFKEYQAAQNNIAQAKYGDGDKATSADSINSDFVFQCSCGKHVRFTDEDYETFDFRTQRNEYRQCVQNNNQLSVGKQSPLTTTDEDKTFDGFSSLNVDLNALDE